MSNRLKKDPYADFRSRLVQKALEEKRKMEMEERQEATYQNSSLRTFSSGTFKPKSALWSDSGHSRETSKIDQNKQSLNLLSKEFMPLPSINKPTNELEANVNNLQPSRIPSPPFLLDHIENEDEFLYGKCDSSPVYQTRSSSLNSSLVRRSSLPKKAESSGWSDEEDFLPMQSDHLKMKTDFSRENVPTKDLKFSNSTWKKYEQTESSIVGVAKVDAPFDISGSNSSEFLKLSCNQELSRTQLYDNKSEVEKDFFGLTSSAVSAPKSSIPDISSFLKDLKQIRTLRNQNVEPKALLHVQRIDDMPENLPSQNFTPIKNQITLNLRNRKLSCTSDSRIFPNQKDSISESSQVSKNMVNQGAFDNQRTAALLVSQLLQKLSTKQGNREIHQKEKRISKPVCNTETDCSDRNVNQVYDKESSNVLGIDKFEIGSTEECSLRRSRKRNVSSDHLDMEHPKKSKGAESVPKKWSKNNTEEESYESSKHTTNCLKKESIKVKEEIVRGVFKIKTQDSSTEKLSFDKYPEKLSFDKYHSENSSDTSPSRSDNRLREKSRDRQFRRCSRSPRKRSRSYKRRSDRSPKKRSRSCKRSCDRSPRKKSFDKSVKHRSCSKRFQSNNTSPQRRSHERSPQKGSHTDDPRRLLQNNSTVFSLSKNSEIKTEINTVSKELPTEGNSCRSSCNESLSVHDQRCNMQIPKEKKSDLGRDNSPKILNDPTHESSCLEGLHRGKNHRKKHSDVAPFISKEIKTRHDSIGSTEILAVQHDVENSDGRFMDFNPSCKMVQKLHKTEQTSTVLKTPTHADSVSGGSDDVASIQPDLAHLVPSYGLVSSEPYAQYSGSSVQNYHTAYQAPSYSEVIDPSAYSYYTNTVPYTSYSGYDSSSYNLYASEYLMENHVQQEVDYSDYYTEIPETHKQIPVINPIAMLEEKKHVLKKTKTVPKKEFRRKAVLVQVDSSAHSSSHKTEDKTEKRERSGNQTEKKDKNESKIENKMEKRDEKRVENKIEKIDRSGSKSEKKENGGKVEKSHDDTKRNRNEDNTDVKDTSKSRTEKKDRHKCKTEKEGRREDQGENNDSTLLEEAVTSEEKELLSRKIEMKKQIENLHSEYVRMSKLQGEMMRKMRREKDGHKDCIITAYGKLQDEIKVQLTDLTSAVGDIDKELEKKEIVKSSVPGTEEEFSKKVPMAERTTKGKFVSTMVEVNPEDAEFYDPGGHWCQNCNKLTTTVYDMLLHLKSKEHKQHMDPLDKPWLNKSLKKIRSRNEVDITKSYHVKGVQFMMPVDGFYCSLCKLTFPDSAVAEDHIVSKEHNAAYKKLIAENPVYERRRILDRLTGVAIIQKEENKRRFETERDLANKTKKQEEEMNKKKESSKRKEEKQASDKEYGKNKEEIKESHIFPSKTNSKTERKNAIKLTLLESKKSKCVDRSTGEGKPKQTVVYIGRAPNYKPRTHENFTSKLRHGDSCSSEIKKDIWSRKKSLITKPYRCNLKQNKKDGGCNQDSSMNSSPQSKIFQKVLTNIKTSGKTFPAVTTYEVASNEKEAADCDSRENLNEIFDESYEKTVEAVSLPSRKQSPANHNCNGKMYANSDTSTRHTADTSKAEEVCSQNAVNEDVLTSKACGIAAVISAPKNIVVCDSSRDELNSSPGKLASLDSMMDQNESMNSATKNFLGNTHPKIEKKSKMRAVHFPLTEEETDLLLLGIDKNDQVPLAVPKPPPSVIASKSIVALGAGGTSTQGDITWAKCISSKVTENSGVCCDSKNIIFQQDNSLKSKDDNIFLEQWSRKAKEYAENSSVQSSLTYNQNLHQDLPRFPYQTFYYYPNTENNQTALWATTQPSSMSLSGMTYAVSQASNSYLSVVSKIPTILDGSKTQAAVKLQHGVSRLPAVEGSPITKEVVSQDQISIYSPSFHITTATVQANPLQKSNTVTVQAIVSQKTSITSIESNIPQKPNISTAESNILKGPQKQSSTPAVCTQNCSVLQGSIFHLPNMNGVKTQTDFDVPSPVIYNTDAKSKLVASSSMLEKSCAVHSKISSSLNDPETTSFPTTFPPMFSSNHSNVRKAVQSSQGNEVPPVTNISPSKRSNNIDVQSNVPLAPLGMNITNEENFPDTQQRSILQQKSTPSDCTAHTVSASFPAASPLDTQTSSGKQENVTHQPVTDCLTDVKTNMIISVTTGVNNFDNSKSSYIHRNISEVSTDPSDIQNSSAKPGNIFSPSITNCVPSDLQVSGAPINISQPVAMPRYAPQVSLPLISESSNFTVPEHAVQPQQNSLKQSAPVFQGNISQPPPVNCNPSIPGIPPQENVPCQPLVHLPPNIRGSSAVVGNMSLASPDIRHSGNQPISMAPGSIPQLSPNANLQVGHCTPPALGDVSQPPLSHPQNNVACITPNDVSKPPPPGSHSGNLCVPPVPGTDLKSPPNSSFPENQRGSIISSSVSCPPHNISLSGNVQTSQVLGNILQPSPNISCTRAPRAPPGFRNASQPPLNIGYRGNQHFPVMSSITYPPPGINHWRCAVRGNMSHPPRLQNAFRSQITLPPHISSCVNGPANVSLLPHRYPPEIHSSTSLFSSAVSNHFQNHSVNKSQNYPSSPYNSKLFLPSGVSLWSTPNKEIRSVAQGNVQPPCMPFSSSNHLNLGSSYQQPSICSASQCNITMKVVPTPGSSTCGKKNSSSPCSTTNRIPVTINSQIDMKSICPSVAVTKSKSGSLMCENDVLQSRVSSDVPSMEQVVFLPSVPHNQDIVSVTSAPTVLPSEEKFAKYEYSTCAVINPAPPGTESITDLWSSHLLSQKDLKCGQSHSEKVKSNAEICIADKFANSDSVDESVEQCLNALITSVCSEELGESDEDVKSLEMCRDSKLQEIHRNSKRDSIIGLNVDMASEGRQLMPASALSSQEFDAKENTTFCEKFQGVLTSSLPSCDGVMDQKGNVPQLPCTFIKNKSEMSKLDVTEGKKDCFQVQSNEVNTVLNAQHDNLIHHGQNFSLNNVALFKVPPLFQQRDSRSASVPKASSFPEVPSNLVPLSESSVSFIPVPPGTDPVIGVKLLNSSHQLSMKSSPGNEETSSHAPQMSEPAFKKIKSYQEHVEAADELLNSSHQLSMKSSPGNEETSSHAPQMSEPAFKKIKSYQEHVEAADELLNSSHQLSMKSSPGNEETSSHAPQMSEPAFKKIKSYQEHVEAADELLNSSHQLSMKSSPGNEETSSHAPQMSEPAFKKIKSYQEHVEAADELVTSTPAVLQLKEDYTGKSMAAVSCVSSSSNPLYRDEKAEEVSNNCRAVSSEVCLSEHSVNKPLELNCDNNKVELSRTENDVKHIDASVTCYDLEKACHDKSKNLGSQNCNYSESLRTKLENSSQLHEIHSTLQNNTAIVSENPVDRNISPNDSQFSQDSTTCREIPLFQGPLFKGNIVNSFMSPSESFKCHKPYNSFNPAPPGTDPVSEFHPPTAAEIQKPSQELCVNSREEIVNSQSLKSTNEKPKMSAEINTSMAVSEESNVSRSLLPKPVPFEETTVVSSSMCSFTNQTDIRDDGLVTSTSDNLCPTGKACSVQELVNQETQLVREKTNKEANSVRISSSANSDSQSKEHVSDTELVDFENVSETQSSFSCNVQCSSEGHTQQLVCSSVCNSLDDNKVFSTQSDTVQNVSPSFKSYSLGIHSFNPHLAVPVSFHQSFTKHQLMPQCSETLNPVPPGTEPVVHCQPMQNSENHKSSLGCSKSGIQEYLNRFDEATNKNIELSLKNVNVSEEFTKESNVSTCSRQPQDSSQNRSVAPPVSAEKIFLVPSDLKAKSSEVQELHSHSENAMETSYPSDHLRKQEVSTSEKSDKNEISVLTSPIAESQESLEGMEVCSHSSTMVRTET